MTEPSENFVIKPNTFKGIKNFIWEQLFVTPQLPNTDFTNQTVIVTGSNIGLGLEAARHFYNLNCAKLILAVRDVEKGKLAKEDIVQSVRHRSDHETIETWSLDLSSTESTLGFAERVRRDLSRVDVVIENAGVNARAWGTFEGFEQTIQINVVNTLLLGLSLLPKLQETKVRFTDSLSHLVIVTSEAYRLSSFPEVNTPDIYATFNDDKQIYAPQKRYETSKLLQVLFIRELISRLETSKSPVPPPIINLVCPGLNKSTTNRSDKPVPLGFRIVRWIFDRNREIGSRSYVFAAAAVGLNSHGQVVKDGKIAEAEEWIGTEVGRKVQKKVFEQTLKVLQERKPGLGESFGL